jgi:cell division transport system ATP-binding protein
MIEFYNVSLKIDNRPIVTNITFRILRGEFIYLVGPSGAGKSSILNLVNLINFPTEGMVIVENFSSAKIRDRGIPLLRRKLGVVFQDFKLLSDRNVFDNVAFALRVIGVKGAEVKRRVMRVLTEVNLGHKRNHFPNELSGGEQQRVAIARAIVNDPLIILADEPTGNLDNRNAVEIMQILEKINHGGTAVLMATHNTSLITNFPHRIIHVEQGVLKDA